MAVNLSPIGGVAGQFFDNNGNPLSGGRILTYSAGTTTPQATYTSANGTTPHANPIILDAAGRVPGGEIWLTDGLQYKFIIQTSTSVQIGSYDNIIGINSNFVNYTNAQEIQTATAGQTVFTLTTMQYQPGTNSLSVFVDGVNQYGPGSQYAYEETSATVVTFASGLHVGAQVKFTTSAINASSYGDAEQINYTPPFTGGVATNVEAKLAETVSVIDFGAVGDGVTDDTAAIQAALNTGKSIFVPSGNYSITGNVSYFAENQKIVGFGTITQTVATAYIVCNGHDYCSIEGVTIAGTGASGGIIIEGGAASFSVLNITFLNGQQRVWLRGCNRVFVSGCSFIGTGYGVISQAATINNNVTVTGCYAKDMEGDFVISNSASTTEKNWVVTNNTYVGAAGYPSAVTERRFASFTRCENVIIDGNTIEKSCGDAAIHCEETYGETIISNNTFNNCLTSGGNEGYIYLLNDQEHTVILGNIFRRDDATLPLAYAVDVSSGLYTCDVQFTGNRVFGNGATGNLSGLSWNFQTGQTLISDNVFSDLVLAIKYTTANNVSFLSNKLNDCNGGISCILTSTSSGGTDWLVGHNTFQNTVGTYDIYALQNTNGTNAPQKWTVIGNIFQKQVLITGQPGAVANSSGDAQDIALFNNVFRSSASVSFSGTMSRFARFGNMFQNTTVNETPRIEGLPNYANDAAAAAGGVPIGGLYRNGSVIQVRVT